MLPKNAWDARSENERGKTELEAFVAEVGKKSSGAEAAKIRSIAYHNLGMAKMLLKNRGTGTQR